mmetsp:Transcript_103958/g.238004  ORF Transcript_103958/g.238004 Transcript_103958/m.238004 type:complete len:531 (+) Transcript_103958:100-1692(+)
MHKYRLISKKGEGTFSEVLKAQSIKTGRHMAIKCMKNHFDTVEQVNNLREIQALRRLSPHPHIIKLHEVLYDEPTGRLALVFELMDMNMYECIRGRRHYLPEAKVKMYMYQLCKAMDHMHRNGIFHRDIKPENVLIGDDTLKLADLGSCRGIYSKQPYTEYISTRWYRAPECLLTDGYYSYKMDMWGVGCVFFEVMSLFPLFPGTDEVDQIRKIHAIIGTPPQDVLQKFQRNASHMDFNFQPQEGTGFARLIPHASAELQELIVRLLAYNPDDRLSARQALKHPYFKDLRDAEKAQAKEEARERAPEVTSPPRQEEAQEETARSYHRDRDTQFRTTGMSVVSSDRGGIGIEEDSVHGGGSTLPQIKTGGGGAAGPAMYEAHGDDEDPEDTTLPPIKLMGKKRDGKDGKSKAHRSHNPKLNSSVASSSGAGASMPGGNSFGHEKLAPARKSSMETGQKSGVGALRQPELHASHARQMDSTGFSTFNAPNKQFGFSSLTQFSSTASEKASSKKYPQPRHSNKWPSRSGKNLP